MNSPDTPTKITLDWKASEEGLTPHLLVGSIEQKVAWAAQDGGQRAFLACHLPEVLAEGNRGASKTDALLMDFAQDCGQGYGAEWHGMLFRHTYPQLRDVVVKTQKWFPRIFPGIRFTAGNQLVWTWPDGEFLTLGFFSRPEDFRNYQGFSIPWIGFEELTNWADDTCYKLMKSCCRSADPRVARLARQRATANAYGCVRYGEVLTADRGWVPIQEVVPGEFVVSVRADGTATTAAVQDVVEQDYTGTLISREGRGLRMEFTEDHRLPRTDGSLHRFCDLPSHSNIRRTASGWDGDVEIDGDLMEFVGWFLSEGCAIRRDRALQIAQNKPENRVRIEALLQRMGVHYRKDPQCFVISDCALYERLSPQGRCREKFIPRGLLNATTAGLSRLLEALMLGDGCGTVYYTTSRQLADDVAEIGTKLGYSVYITQRQRIDRVGPSYSVNLARRATIQLHTGNHKYNVSTTCHSVNVKRTPFQGKVYCLVVPGPETFFLRQNGCVWLSGNSGHNWVKRRFRLPILPGRTVGEIIRDSYDREGNLEEARCAIHFDLSENKILLAAQPDYLNKVKAAARNESEYRAWVYDDWDIVAGGMFDAVYQPKVHLVPNFPLTRIPESWYIDRSYDHGQSKPFSVGWWAESSGEPLIHNGHVYGQVRGDLYRIAEWYGWTGEDNKGLDLVATAIGRGVLDREADWGLSGRVHPGPADGSIFNKDASGKSSTASDMAGVGCHWEKADQTSGSRKQGWERIRQMMVASTAYPREEPGIFWLERCEQSRRTLFVLPRDEKDMDDVDTESEDHVGDETRYRVRHQRSIAQIGAF
jgi:hypothetical protein